MDRVPRPLFGSSVLACLIAAGMLVWVGLGNLREDQAAANAPYRALRGADAEAERAALESLLAEAYAERSTA